MKWCWSLAALVLLFIPVRTEAQFREPFPTSRLSISPMVGYRFPYVARFDAAIYSDDEVFFSEFTEERSGGATAGGEVEMHIFGPIGLIGSALYAPSVENRVAENNEPAQRFVGPDVWLLSAGISIRLPEPAPDYRRFPLLASINLAPGVVREVPQGSPLPPDHPQHVPSPWQPINHPALDAGVKATILLGSRHLAFQFGVSDFITFWNSNAVERQLEQAYLQQLRLPVTAVYNLGRSHLFQAYAGFSIRF
ncbi:hypothetical protein BH23GEM3_BH23GEM3_03040 [soil metagenome]